MADPKSSNQKEPSKLTKLTSGDKAESPLARLPRLKATPHFDAPASSVPAAESRFSYSRFAAAFWTVTGTISLIVNSVLIGLLLVLRSVLGVSPIDVNQKASGVLGGLYNNFALMQDAHIKTEIQIKKDIPVVFDLNVTGPTDVVLTREVIIEGARVTVNTGGLNIDNAIARIVLPVNTRLPINIEGLKVPVNQTVTVQMNVPVDIALTQTDLNDPFEGLQNIVKPYLCLVQPTATRPSKVETAKPIFVCEP